METTVSTTTIDMVIAYAEGVATSGWKPKHGATDGLVEAYRLFAHSIECGEAKYRGSYDVYTQKKKTIAHEVITACILAHAQECDDHNGCWPDRLRMWARVVNLWQTGKDGNKQATTFLKRKWSQDTLMKQAAKFLGREGEKYGRSQLFTDFYYADKLERWCATDGFKLAILPEGSCPDWDTTGTYNKNGARSYDSKSGAQARTWRVVEDADDRNMIPLDLYNVNLSDLYNVVCENKVLRTYADAIRGLTSIEVDQTAQFGWVKYGDQYFNVEHLLPFMEYATMIRYAKGFDPRCIWQGSDQRCAMTAKHNGEVVALVMPVAPIDDFNGVVLGRCKTERH
jgi:hypothetical protein